ncbi:MAG: HAD family hydrolase [Spirochaetales bacterium]|nr:HAD family hydrolase [Candidatus Physcosoma equi]
MKLNFFFDLDGTLLPFGQSIKESAVEAIRKAQAEGHRMFVCTGRSPAELDPRLSVIHFDGGVFSAGGTVILDGKELYRRRYTEEEKKFVFSYLKEQKFLPMVQTEDGTYLTPEGVACFRDNLQKHIGTVIDVPGFIVMDEIPEDITVNKFLFLSPDGRGDQVRRDLKDKFVIVDNTVGLPQSMMAEIVLKGVTKATGMARILEAVRETRESSVGIGDGANDMEMVEYAGLGVAMGNASPELKDNADYITGDCDKEGIAEAIAYATTQYSHR